MFVVHLQTCTNNNIENDIILEIFNNKRDLLHCQTTTEKLNLH